MIDLKPYVQSLAGKPVAVFGLGLSGMACVRALVAAGAVVHVWDDDEVRRKAAEQLGAAINNLSALDGYAFLLLSPGIPLHHPAPHPVVERARAAEIPIIGDIELLHRAGHGLKTIGVTGTNGKSTTTALIGHILARAGLRPAIGGNIGTAVMEMNLAGAGIIVLELSSYQLDLCDTFAPDIAIHLNLTPDHIDRHGDLNGYINAKMRIFRGAGDAVIGMDDDSSKAMAELVQKSGQRIVYGISTAEKIRRGAYVREGKIHDTMQEQDDVVGNLTGCANLQGIHNHQNAAAAYVACRLVAVKPETVFAGMGTYPGLPHRMFTVRTLNGVAYVNDSKATNADAAGKALACYRNIYWILGGKPKAGGLSGLEPLMDRVRHAFVIGEAAEDFSAWLKNNGVPVRSCGTLERAVADAHLLAQGDRGQPGGAEVVLLSPACASFDQFRSFEHRGDVFADIVLRLEENTMREAAR